MQIYIGLRQYLVMKKFYDRVAEGYDLRNSCPATMRLRRLELKAIRRFARGRVLDIGCGTGFHLGFLNGCVGVDSSGAMLRKALENHGDAALVKGDAELLPFSDRTFDSVICMHSVLNIVSLEKASSEISRVLKPGGFAVVSFASIHDREKRRAVKTESRESVFKRVRIEGNAMRMRLFSRREVSEAFGRCGMEDAWFGSVFSLVSPVWGSFKPFSARERLLLLLERILPVKERGRVYVMAFRKA